MGSFGKGAVGDSRLRIEIGSGYLKELFCLLNNNDMKIKNTSFTGLATCTPQSSVGLGSRASQLDKPDTSFHKEANWGRLLGEAAV